ncbi:hypothetical protein L211DRAFT_504367 [Terfezia boudieri ATCC MYA-4762]|uniref:Uncharacterized protein n=1 Tax=Terfezia boudieri ATCC MYA-4762 TaxID=1051890 RepID=A0A3N4LH10_9PEZI|nr:hypothetical protein L211DRAFT_504367 [Terfezia boudieri ATCC MYA-4762]
MLVLGKVNQCMVETGGAWFMGRPLLRTAALAWGLKKYIVGPGSRSLFLSIFSSTSLVFLVFATLSQLCSVILGWFVCFFFCYLG